MEYPSGAISSPPRLIIEIALTAQESSESIANPISFSGSEKVVIFPARSSIYEIGASIILGGYGSRSFLPFVIALGISHSILSIGDARISSIEYLRTDIFRKSTCESRTPVVFVWLFSSAKTNKINPTKDPAKIPASR